MNVSATIPSTEKTTMNVMSSAPPASSPRSTMKAITSPSNTFRSTGDHRPGTKPRDNGVQGYFDFLARTQTQASNPAPNVSVSQRNG